MMIAGRPSAQAPSRRALTLSAPVARGRTSIFSLPDRKYHVTASAMPIISPGAMPARNSLEMDRLAATPSRMKPIDGGMIGPMVDEQAVMAPANSGVKRFLSVIMRIDTRPGPAASAMALPLMPEKIRLTSTLT